MGKDIRLVDPAKLSKDPNTSVSIVDISKDGGFLAYGVRQGGADEQEIHFLNLKTSKAMEDTLPSDRYNSVDFAPDMGGVYYLAIYTRGPFSYFHKFGTRASADTLLFGP